MCFSNQGPQQPLLNTYNPIWRNLNIDSWNNIQDTLELLAQSTLQFQQSTNSMIQEHSTALTKLEIQLGQIEKEKPKEACCAYFHSEDPELYKDEELYILPKPYVLPLPFPRRFSHEYAPIKQHDEPPIDVLGETLSDIVFEAFPLSSNSIYCFSKSVSDSPCCFTSFQVPYLESLENDLLPFQEGKKLKFDNETLLPSQTKEDDMVSHFIHKERQKCHHNQVFKPLLPTKVWRYLDFLPA
ncbi:hypothetical protein D8674_011625 [Pyrus ussuriensis x Pyrus communis]|uniref:Uncharacterized protein n=1 Tax=Pyrus ussuriensis x Pyrus communis TaxID=2448454 RepID=A0A5N5G023_9ROSA|nr:hypothetical protein D8674_011625 [Pyrus ussuriensis x Pyrus communis]